MFDLLVSRRISIAIIINDVDKPPTEQFHHQRVAVGIAAPLIKGNAQQLGMQILILTLGELAPRKILCHPRVAGKLLLCVFDPRHRSCARLGLKASCVLPALTSSLGIGAFLNSDIASFLDQVDSHDRQN